MRTIRHRTGRESDGGFTLIELLVVVVIIGVLVAIAVPVYLNYRKGAADKSAQSDVRGAVSTLELYYTENGSKYPPASLLSQATSPITIGGQKIILSDKTTLTLYLASATATSYLLCAFNSGGTANKYYVYNSGSGGSASGKTYATFDMTTCTGT